MHRRTVLRSLLAAPWAGKLTGRQAQPDPGDWRPLFNGKDLAGWDTYLGRPHPSVRLPDRTGTRGDESAPAIGLNLDPTGVFSVVEVDGAPAIRISGEIYGGLITRHEYEDYHLRFEFKWGDRRWPPREQALRDTGCCYHSVGPHGASYGFWMQSFEFQIQEGDCGDFYSLAGVIVDVEGVRNGRAGELIYKQGAPKVVGHTRRVVKSADHERPRGSWNSMELYCVQGSSAHVVNGHVNMVLTGLRREVAGRQVPLTRGKIQFQSEGAEVFFRRVELRRMRTWPAGTRPAGTPRQSPA